MSDTGDDAFVPLTPSKRGSGFGAQDSQRKIGVWGFVLRTPQNPNRESGFSANPEPRIPNPGSHASSNRARWSAGRVARWSPQK